MHSPIRWRAIMALNMVSALSQTGQFGIGFVILPVWLSHQGFDAKKAGCFASVQWAGMLAALCIAPMLIKKIGSKYTIFTGLVLTVIAFWLLALWPWSFWFLPGALTGIGIGLRWIANETWLFQLVPLQMRGHLVGFHETLIAVAGVMGPALAMWLGADNHAIFWAGAMLTLAAALPLNLVTDNLPNTGATQQTEKIGLSIRLPVGTLMLLGIVVAAVGGLGDGALYGLFPLFTKGHGLSTHQTTMLLALFGIGTIAAQFPVGWCANRFGLPMTVAVCALLCAAAALTLTLSLHLLWLSATSALLLGGMSAAFLTLGIYAAASAHTDAMTHNMRLVSISFTGSAIAGPLVAGITMKGWGSDMLMWLIAVISAMLMLYAFVHQRLLSRSR